MLSLTTVPTLTYPQEYFYAIALAVAGAVNIVLSLLLIIDSNSYLYAEAPRYRRSRLLTGLSLAVFGIGFLIHWLFMPHFTNLLLGKALSFSYFHIGGVLLSLSHTGLIDRHYFCRRVVVRDVSLLILSLCVYWFNAYLANTFLTYTGSVLFFLHIGYLTFVFYSRFYHIYKQLEEYADFMPNDTDKEMLWLHYSCHLIIVFGILGVLCTVVFHNATMPFIILLLVGIAVFTYIYRALSNFGAIASEAEGNILASEEYVLNENPSTGSGQAEDEDVKECIEQWVTGRYYADPKITIKDALGQMGITENALNYYLERYTTQRGYRQWITFLRIEESKRQMLLHPAYSLQAISEACGYANSSSLSRSFKAQEGMSPMEWLKRNRK